MDWEWVKDQVATYGYLAVALGTLWDQSGMQAFVVAGGIVASVTERITLPGVALAGAAGSFLSDITLFAVGRWRARWLERILKSDKNRMRLVLLQEGLSRWGFVLLTLGRFLPWLGRFVPAAAGLRRFSKRKAALYCALGSLISGALFASLGYYAAESISWFDQYAIYIGIGALVLSFPIAGLLLKRIDREVARRLEAEHAAVNGDARL